MVATTAATAGEEEAKAADEAFPLEALRDVVELSADEARDCWLELDAALLAAALVEIEAREEGVRPRRPTAGLSSVAAVISEVCVRSKVVWTIERCLVGDVATAAAAADSTKPDDGGAETGKGGDAVTDEAGRREDAEDGEKVRGRIRGAE